MGSFRTESASTFRKSLPPDALNHGVMLASAQ
jgi:hypothetical protein